MANNPKLEFFRFSLHAKDGKKKTFRDFAISELGESENVSNDEAFKACFAHFIKGIETKHAKSKEKKKTITIIANANTNPYISSKPSPMVRKHLITGIINGGPYDKDAIVSDITDKEINSKLGRNKSVLLPYFVFVYLPPDHYEGCFAIHSNSTEESVTGIFRGYIRNLFSGDHFYKANPLPFCPKSFQDEFKEGAVIQNVMFTTTVIDNTSSNDPIRNLLTQYDITIQATPKEKSISFTEADTVVNFFKQKIFKSRSDRELKLDDFRDKKLTAKNEVTQKTKVFEFEQKDNPFVPVVLLTGRIKIDDGSPNFNELKELCVNTFESEILKELRPDLNVKKSK